MMCVVARSHSLIFTQSKTCSDMAHFVGEIVAIIRDATVQNFASSLL